MNKLVLVLACMVLFASVEALPEFEKMPFLDFLCGWQDTTDTHTLDTNMRSSFEPDLAELVFLARTRLCLLGKEKLDIATRFSTETAPEWQPTRNLVFASMNTDLKIAYDDAVRQLVTAYKLDELYRLLKQPVA